MKARRNEKSSGWDGSSSETVVHQKWSTKTIFQLKSSKVALLESFLAIKPLDILQI